jgi:hypothetical protein
MFTKIVTPLKGLQLLFIIIILCIQYSKPKTKFPPAQLKELVFSDEEELPPLPPRVDYVPKAKGASPPRPKRTAKVAASLEAAATQRVGLSVDALKALSKPRAGFSIENPPLISESARRRRGLDSAIATLASTPTVEQQPDHFMSLYLISKGDAEKERVTSEERRWREKLEREDREREERKAEREERRMEREAALEEQREERRRRERMEEEAREERRRQCRIEEEERMERRKAEKEERELKMLELRMLFEGKGGVKREREE